MTGTRGAKADWKHGNTMRFLVTLSAPKEVVDLSSDLRQPDYEMAKLILMEERAKRTLVREEVNLASDTVHSLPREVVPS